MRYPTKPAPPRGGVVSFGLRTGDNERRSLSLGELCCPLGEEPSLHVVEGSVTRPEEFRGPGDLGRGLYSADGHMSRDGRTIRGAPGVTGLESSFMIGSPLVGDGDGDLAPLVGIIMSRERRSMDERSMAVKPLSMV